MRTQLLKFTCLLTFAASPALADEWPPVEARLLQPREGLGNVLAKLERGERVRVAYFGGSITAANGWRPMTMKWFREKYPKAQVEEIHAAIGGTPSLLGAFRNRRDVLDKEPDLVFVEFSVNDGWIRPPLLHQTMEGIVRQTWIADPWCDICFVYTFRVGYEKELRERRCPRAPSGHERVAAHYGIPGINVALRVVELEEEGKLVFKLPRGEKDAEGRIVFSNDGVHPTKAGHEVYTDVIGESMTVLAEMARPGPHFLVRPFDEGNYEDAKLVDLEPSMFHGSWKKMDVTRGLGKRFHNRLPVIWHGGAPGDAVSFKFKGTTCKVYDLLGPDGGRIKITLDGKEQRPRDRFDHYCTYHRLADMGIADNVPDTVHTVRLEIMKEQPDRESVLSRVRDKPNFNPKKYDGTNMWVGYIMLRGELVD